MSEQKSQQEGPFLDLLMIAYGSSSYDPNDYSRFTGETQRRVEITLSPQIPADIAGNLRRINAWSRERAGKIAHDIKHTQRWHCEFCDKLARETQLEAMSWIHLTPPKLVVYIHLVCDLRKGPCAEQVRMLGLQMAAKNGGRRASPAHLLIDDTIYPAGASCTKCEREDTIGLSMSRCSGCKLSRYCSAKCQKQDWARHKLTCKVVCDVKWVWT